MAKETYRFARNAGDANFLWWLRDRLVNIYGESPDVDFVLCLEDFAKGINEVVVAAGDAKDFYHVADEATGDR